jgi:outer membrane protein
VSRLAQARNQVIDSEQNFLRLTGLRPDQLDPPPPLPTLPADADEAELVALKNNPELLAAGQVAKAAHYDVAQARGGRLPTLSVTAGDNYYLYQQRILDFPDQRENVAQAGVSLTLPLYQGGLVSAQVRAQKDAESAALEQRTAIERQTVADTHAFYSSYQTALATIDSSEAAVKADTSALTGVRIEANAGLRQVLDVLNAELEVLDSQVALASARHDAYVAGFELLNTMGMVNYRQLNLDGGTLYDPTLNYRHAVHTLSDLADGPPVQAVSTPTYGPVAPYDARPTPAS